MKIIDNAIMHQDYKARENLEREISIMKMLKSCDNVVQIFMAGVSETTMMQLPSGSYGSGCEICRIYCDCCFICSLLTYLLLILLSGCSHSNI